MADRKIKRALISVYDKTGIVDFARTLVEEFGIEIISTGGTAKLLKENSIPVTLVEDITGWGEMLDGRVKTLHPKIHAAILADRDNPKHMQQLAEAGIEPIDMVVVNLYPFEKTVADPNCKFEDAIEMIDIGGPCMLRAAAKNHRHVWVVIGARSYGSVIELMRNTQSKIAMQRQWDATQAFRIVSSYNAHIFKYLISNWMASDRTLGPSGWEDLCDEERETRAHPMLPPPTSFPSYLRYGENPHQRAQVASTHDDELHEPWSEHLALGRFPRPGEEIFFNEVALSFNNHLDTESCYLLCKELMLELRPTRQPNRLPLSCCTFVKHTNACGVGIGEDPLGAYERAYLGDPNAAMGGILVCSFPITPSIASVIMDTYARWGKAVGTGGFFIEVWVAPSFDRDAVAVIRREKPWGRRARLLRTPDGFETPFSPEILDFRYLYGRALAQTRDTVGLNEDQWQLVTKRPPSDAELADLRLAWLVAKHTKSNAISICKDGMLIGNGAGQMSRVMSCRIATWLAKENGHAGKLAGSAAASDAFFPFRDGPDILADAGVTAIIQPGGSKRDADTIAACDERGIAMIFTGTRHFKH